MIVIPFYGRGNRGSETLIKSLAQGNSEVEAELKPLLLRGSLGYQSQVTGLGNGEVKGHETTLSFPRLALLVTETLLLSLGELKGITEMSPGPGLPGQCPLQGRSSTWDFRLDAGALKLGEVTQDLSLNEQALGGCAQWLIPFSFCAPQCLQTVLGTSLLPFCP